MKNWIKLGVFIAGIMIILSACSDGGSRSVTRAFYYWKSGDIRLFENHIFEESNAQKLYIKIFEITLDDLEGAIPQSKAYTEFTKEFLDQAEIVPTIFIENDVIAKSTTEQLDELAKNTVSLTEKFINDKLKANSNDVLRCNEIQIDCDWMASSKESYFKFLKAIKKYSDKQISCTVRLYPYKFTKEMGVPPVDRVMLLCYNLLNPKNHSDKNTILDLEELKKYVQTDNNYPLPLDVGLPAYSSCYMFVNGKFDEVRHAVPEDLEEITLEKTGKLWYTVERDTSFKYDYYKGGQQIKIERVSAKLLLDATKMIVDNVELDDELTVAIYHLDENELNQYKHETLDSVYLLFSKR